MGVRHFVFIDNGSGDGTEQFLMGQEDVTLYSAPWPFEHRRKSGWLLQAIEETGTDRWYLRLDSDEFLTWEGMETSCSQTCVIKAMRCFARTALSQRSTHSHSRGL